jgi:hypothetical protein
MVLDGLPMCLVRQPFWHLTTLPVGCLIWGMKHYFLVAIAIPDRRKPVEWQSWLGFLDFLATHMPAPAGTNRLAESVWLIERDGGASVFASLISAADSSTLKHSVRFLMEDESAVSQPPP